MHEVNDAISHTHPVMEEYTGHLVGHAHIDLQWLWEWQEGIVFTADTFRQAAKFMDEFKGFTFSQSSSCLYQAIEEHYPDLFAHMKKKVANGQWELVGGRVCEGDTNMISHESHARHFLYGQSYFRERFKKTAVVGWEPDTFGHTIQMPQILKMGGCDYYYFCRGGKDAPLFWWQGLDGTKVLAFDEPATGSWYNSDLSEKNFQELLDFEKDTGSKDTIWVYGIGNHGGGPTREQIEQALAWMKSGNKPNVKFSTATQFFKKLETKDLSKIPTVKDDLNPVFDGCYTSHSEIKQLNRQAEALTTSAEAVAAVASLGGFKYPGSAFRTNWEQIAFEHHHDTLPGSGTHPPYERTKTTLGRVIAEDKEIITRALESMVVKLTPKQGGLSLMVFNPTGWKRNGWIETYLVKSGWDSGEDLDPANAVVEAPDGRESRVILLDKRSKFARFWAADVPAFGYRAFRIKNAEGPRIMAADVSVEWPVVETDKLTVKFNQDRGTIDSIKVKETGRTFGGGLGKVEVHWENVQNMSAWVLGKVDKFEPMRLVGHAVASSADHANVTFRYVLPAHNAESRPTVVVQTFRILGDSDEVTCQVDCDWQAVGTRARPNPMLRVAFANPMPGTTATFQVPFGAYARPTNGREFPGLQWADLSAPEAGIAVLNDSKHGFSAESDALRISLIRASFEPDPVPNPGKHTWHYSIVPHERGWQNARLTQRAAEFNQPLLPITVPFDAHGDAPHEFSAMSVSADNVVPTCLKLAEDGSGMVMRAYESLGVPANARIRLGVPPTGGNWVNFLEDRLASAAVSANAVEAVFRPWEIKTLKLALPRRR
ncbi:MAG: alpha-mannosidase [Armatimonadetes bacterium]|nr:alpha-mannosidase [Armatimonadota bacterium]